jgi:hypothetical protein
MTIQPAPRATIRISKRNAAGKAAGIDLKWRSHKDGLRVSTGCREAGLLPVASLRQLHVSKLTCSCVKRRSTVRWGGRPCLSGRSAWPASTKSPTLKVLWLAQLPGCRGQSRRGKATSCHQRHRQHSPDLVPIFCRQTQAPIRDIMFAARQLSLVRPVAGRRLFHATAPAFVKVGDKVPNVELTENSPGNKINIAQELKSGKGLIIGEPFTPLHHSRRVSLQLRLIYCHLQVFLPPTRPLARRTIFPDISTLLNSKMPARSLLFPSTTALCK